MDTQQYLSKINDRLKASFAVANIAIVKEYSLPDRGYLRARLTLRNGEFLEVADGGSRQITQSQVLPDLPFSLLEEALRRGRESGRSQLYG